MTELDLSDEGLSVPGTGGFLQGCEDTGTVDVAGTVEAVELEGAEDVHAD